MLQNSSKKSSKTLEEKSNKKRASRETRPTSPKNILKLRQRDMSLQNAGVVGNRVIRNFDFLYELVTRRTVRERWEMIQNASKDQLLAVVEICANVQRKNFKLTSKQYRRLKKHWLFVRSLSRVRTPQGARQTIQKGEGCNRYGVPLKGQRGTGFLPAILIPVLVEAAASAIENLIPEPPTE